MWATMAAQYPLLPKPLEANPSTFPPPDPSNKAETLPPHPAGPSQHPWPDPATGNSRQALGFVPEMIRKRYSTARHGLAPATNLPLVQHKSQGSWDMFLCLFSSLVEGPHVDVVLLQDPPAPRVFFLVCQVLSHLLIPFLGPRWPATYS